MVRWAPECEAEKGLGMRPGGAVTEAGRDRYQVRAMMASPPEAVMGSVCYRYYLGIM